MDEALSVSVDVLVKATVLMLLALLLNAFLRGQKPLLVRSALWNALIAGLIVLPMVTLVFPTLRVACLPPLPGGDRSAEAGGLLGSADPGAAERSEPKPMIVPTPAVAVDRRTAAPGVETLAASPSLPDESTLRGPDIEEPAEAAPAVTVVPAAEDDPTQNLSPGWSLFGSACLLSVYLCGLGVLAFRLFGAWLAVQRLRRTGRALSQPAWTVPLARWTKRLQIRQPVKLAASPAVSVPFAFGWLRPTVLIPETLVSTLHEKQCEAVLLHELAHVHRRDYPWQILLKIVQAVYWIHPLVWAIGRSVSSIREQACDDLCTYHAGNPRNYRDTLLEVAAKLTRRPAVSLGIAMARTNQIAKRLERIEGGRAAARCLASRPVRVLAISLGLAATGVVGPLELARQTVAAEAPAKPALELHVVNRDTLEPLGRVDLRIRIDDEDRLARTDAKGHYRIELADRHPRYLAVHADSPKFVPMVVSWSRQEDPAGVPASYILAMEPGSTIGGTARDESGKPIGGAILTISALQPAGRERYDLYHHPVETDSNGRWQCDKFPPRIGGVYIHFEHPDYSKTIISYQDSGETVDQLRARTHVAIMRKPPVLAGQVLDEQGAPLAGATVVMTEGVMNGDNLDRETTDATGKFEMTYYGPIQHHRYLILTASADGRAPERKAVPVDEPVGTLAFRLGPGRTIVGRVADQEGKPVAGTDVSVPQWKSSHPLNWGGETDEQGLFTCERAPLDALTFEVRKKGYATARVQVAGAAAGVKTEVSATMAATNETVVPPGKANLWLEGDVVDAETGEPIPRFRVIPGYFLDTWSNVAWERSEAKTFANGAYDYSFDRSFHGVQFKVEADGYLPGVSPRYRGDEGDLVVDFKLKRGAGPHGVVRFADGKPVAGALVALATTARAAGLRFQNGRLIGYEPVTTTETDANGHFSFPPPSEEWFVAIVHDAGYRELTAQTLSANPDVRLEPWGRAEGTLLMDGKPAGNETVMINYIAREAYSGFDFDLQEIDYWYDVTTDEKGFFRMDKLPRGEARIVHRPKDGRPEFQESTLVSIRAGETVRITLGGPKGRPVTGRAVASTELPSPTDWTHATAILSSDPPPQYPPYDKDAKAYNKARAAFYRTEAGLEYLRYERHGRIALAQDGSFRAESVLPGRYTIRVHLKDPNDAKKPLGVGEIHFEVADIPGGHSDQPLDVGVVEVNPRVSPGQTTSHLLRSQADAGRAGDGRPRLAGWHHRRD